MKAEKEYIQEVSLLIEEEEYDAASEIVDEGLLYYSESSKLLTLKGVILYGINEFDLALQVLEQANEKNSHEVDTSFYLGLIYHKRQDIALAIEYFERVIRTDSSIAEAHNNLGNIYREIREVSLAIEHFTNAIKLDPDFAAPEYNLGLLYKQLEKYQLAFEHFKKAIKKNPHYGEPEAGLADIYYKEREYSLSKKHFLLSLEKNPSCIDAHFGLGWLYFAVYKQPDLAIYHLKIAINEKPEDAYFHYKIGQVYEYVRKPFEAKTHYLRSISLESPIEEHDSIIILENFFSEKPFVIKYLMEKYSYYEYGFFTKLQDSQKKTEDLTLYLTYIRYLLKTNKLLYNYLEILLYFFSSLPFKACYIFNEEINTHSSDINLLGYYYWLQSTSDFAQPENTYTLHLENVLEVVEKVLDTSQDIPSLELYYAGLIYWNKFLISDDLTFAIKADTCFHRSQEQEFLPAAYMRVSTLSSLDPNAVSAQINLVKTWESREGERYLKGYKVQDLALNPEDVLAPFLYYAHFDEIVESINRVNDNSNIAIPEFHNAWYLSPENKAAMQKFIESKQLNELRDSIEKSLTESIGKVIDEEKANKLRKRLKGISTTLNIELDRLFDKAEQMARNLAEDPDSLESELATIIHDCKFPYKGHHLDEVYWGRDMNIQLIAYFFYKGYLLPVQVLSLVYYAIFIDELRKPKPLSFFIFKESGIEGISDSGKDVLEKGPDLLIDIGLSLAIPKAIVLKFLVGFTVKYIIGNVATLLNTKEIKDSAHQHYSDFKKRLETNTFNLIKEYHPKSALEQEALDIIQGWYSYK